MDKKDKRTRLLYIIVIVFLCAVFAVGFVWGLNSVLAMEGSFPPNVLTDGVTPLPDTHEEELSAEDAVDYLNKVFDLALTNEAMISTSVDMGINSDENGYIISTDGSDKLRETLVFLCDDVDDGGTELGAILRADHKDESTDFGEDMSKILRRPVLKASDIVSVECNYVYYKCPSCGVETGEALPECAECGSTEAYERKYRDEYAISLELLNNDEILNADFAPRTPEQLGAMLANEAFESSGITIGYEKFSILLTVERLTDKLTSVSYRKDAVIDADVAFLGGFADLGKTHISFSAYQKDNFRLTWPGISLNKDVTYVEPKGKDNVLATLTCSAPTEMTVTWTSSAPEIVEVDDEGYFKGCKEDGGSAVITAEYEFNGKKYSDSCLVEVKYPVESTALKKNSAKLVPGETFELKLKFSPSNATFKTAQWYTTDENVAIVDENGVITAVSAGSAVVYSLSDDGYFKSSCEVTVTE